jgi:hypothetical protein
MSIKSSKSRMPEQLAPAKRPKNPNKTAKNTPLPPVNNLSTTCQQPVNNSHPTRNAPFKLRIPASLYARCQASADAVNEPVGRWLGLALRHSAATATTTTPPPLLPRRRVIAPPSPAALVVATIISGPIPTESTADLLARLTRVCTFCEARRPKPFRTHLREGVDYLVANPTED